MEEYIDKLKEFYETIKKIKKSKSKKQTIEEIEKIPYYYNKVYLKMLEDSILEEKNKVLTLKYNILYGLSNENDLETYDKIQDKITNLIDQRDKIKLKMDHKIHRHQKELKRLNDDIAQLMFGYKEVPQDRKEIYKQIQRKREMINDILNHDRTIILKEMNKVKIYNVVTDYEPIRGNEMVIESNVNDQDPVIESENLE